MRRRAFITLIGGAAAWPLAPRAEPAKVPTIGFLGAATFSTMSPWSAAFVQRLRELGWIENQTVAIEYRWAEGRTLRRNRGRVRPAQCRCHCHALDPTGRGGEADNLAHSDRVRECRRPRCQRPGREPGAARGQYHRPVDSRHRYRRQAGRPFARGRPRSAPFGDHGQCRQSSRCAGDGFR